jgi:hypothetical protein
VCKVTEVTFLLPVQPSGLWCQGCTKGLALVLLLCLVLLCWGIEPRSLCMLAKPSTDELHPQPNLPAFDFFPSLSNWPDSKPLCNTVDIAQSPRLAPDLRGTQVCIICGISQVWEDLLYFGSWFVERFVSRKGCWILSGVASTCGVLFSFGTNSLLEWTGRSSFLCSFLE